LVEAAGEVFDLCVVACKEAESPYAEDWLQAADEVVACSKENAGRALEAALLAEEKRGANGTMLALTGGAGSSEPAASGDGAERPLYSLGPAATSGARADSGLANLARALVGSRSAGTPADGEKEAAHV
jgi:hypothetical protein